MLIHIFTPIIHESITYYTRPCNAAEVRAEEGGKAKSEQSAWSKATEGCQVDGGSVGGGETVESERGRGRIEPQRAGGRPTAGWSEEGEQQSELSVQS